MRFSEEYKGHWDNLTQTTSDDSVFGSSKSKTPGARKIECLELSCEFQISGDSLLRQSLEPFTKFVAPIEFSQILLIYLHIHFRFPL